MPYYFNLPASFDPLEFLPQRLHMRADDARWLLSTILRKMASRDVDPWGLVRLHSDILRRVMNKRTYNDVIESHLDSAIERRPYKVGEVSFGYRLVERFMHEDSRIVPATDVRLIDRIRREQRRMEKLQAGRLRPIHDQLAREQQHLTITPDANDILSALESANARLCQSVLVNDIRYRRLRFTVSTTGRVFNAISGLKRELRRALRLAGEPLGGIDIQASQPSLLAMMLSKSLAPTNGLNNVATYSIPPPCPCVAAVPPASSAGLAALRLGGPAYASDVARFADAALDGCLYESLASLVGLTRDQAKKRFLVDVLAKDGCYPSEFEDAFRQEYPTVYAAIRHINRENHCTLIRLLQSVEAWLVIDLVCPRLIGEGVPCLTLHDSVYTQVRMLDRVESAFHDAFREIGFELSLKRETPGCN